MIIKEKYSGFSTVNECSLYSNAIEIANKQGTLVLLESEWHTGQCLSNVKGNLHTQNKDRMSAGINSI